MVDQKQKHRIIRLSNGQEVKFRRLSKADIEQRLAKFEAKYGMTSQEFVGKWKRGELECADDYFSWEAYCLFAYKQGRAELQVED